MRILFSYHHQMVSFGTYLWAFVPALAARGHEVHVLSCGHFKNKDECRDGVWVHRRRDFGSRAVRHLARVPLLRHLVGFGAADFPPWKSPALRLRVAASNYLEFRRLVVPVEDVDALAAALRPYLLDPNAADAGGRRACAFVERRLSPERIAGEREAVYEEAIQMWRAQRQGRPTRSGRRRRDVVRKGC